MVTPGAGAVMAGPGLSGEEVTHAQNPNESFHGPPCVLAHSGTQWTVGQVWQILLPPGRARAGRLSALSTIPWLAPVPGLASQPCVK